MITQSDSQILSAAVRAGRAALGWSPAELAEKSGTSLPTVARIEACMTSPKLETISRMIGALEKGGVEFDWKQASGFGMQVKLGRKRS